MFTLVLALAGAAAAEPAPASLPAPVQWRTTRVDLPDGSIAEIEYAGDIPPRVRVSVPVVQGEPPAEAGAQDASYGGIPRARRVVRAPGSAPVAPASVVSVASPPLPEGQPPQFVVAGDMPRGSTYEYSLITTNPDGSVCTERTEWTSRGKGKEPVVMQNHAGEGCATLAASRSQTITPQAVSPQAVSPQPASIQPAKPE